MFTDRRASSLATRRIKQPWPEGQPFKILSLDGGGIKGIFTAELLRKCEQTFCGGKPLASYFDMIAGTSTGGIIALGLGLHFTTDEIVSFYERDGRKIFPPIPTGKWNKLRQLLRWASNTKLQHEELEKALKSRFQGRLLGESHARLVVPAFMMPKTEIAVFKTDHHKDFVNDHLTPMWKVARSTSAAPTFLKGLEHEESGKIFIDGGVWANNPVMVALVDAITDYDISFEQVEVLSIGTGNAPFELSKKDALAGLIAWREAIKAAMFLTTDNATAQVKLLLGPDRCLRIEPDEAAATIDMDDYDRAFSILPNAALQRFEQYHEALGKFFEIRTSPRERHYSNQRG
ncbi:MAG: CBASS cGAMP-activated phospholipase [Parvularculaceae bacterium]